MATFVRSPSSEISKECHLWARVVSERQSDVVVLLRSLSLALALFHTQPQESGSSFQGCSITYNSWWKVFFIYTYKWNRYCRTASSYLQTIHWIEFGMCVCVCVCMLSKQIRGQLGSGGRAVEHRTVNRGDSGSIPPTAVLKPRQFLHPTFACVFRKRH